MQTTSLPSKSNNLLLDGPRKVSCMTSSPGQADAANERVASSLDNSPAAEEAQKQGFRRHHTAQSFYCRLGYLALEGSSGKRQEQVTGGLRGWAECGGCCAREMSPPTAGCTPGAPAAAEREQLMSLTMCTLMWLLVSRMCCSSARAWVQSAGSAAFAPDETPSAVVFISATISCHRSPDTISSALNSSAP